MMPFIFGLIVGAFLGVLTLGMVVMALGRDQ